MPLQVRRDNWENDRQFDEVQQLAQAIEETKPVLPENVTTAQKNAMQNPGLGRTVFDTTLDKLCVFTSGGWETITSV